MSTTDQRPIEVGDRFEDDDKRKGERVIRITRDLGDDFYRYRVEVAARNPRTVGFSRRISGETLRTRYTRISH